MGGEFVVDPASLRAVAGQLDGHAAEVVSHGETLSANTAGHVGRGAIGEVVESAVRRGIELVAHDLSNAVEKFYRDSAAVMGKAADETVRTDGEVGSAFDAVARRQHDVRVGHGAFAADVRAGPGFREGRGEVLGERDGEHAVRGAVDDSELSGPWVKEATNVEKGGAVAQSRPGSCVAACGEMLTGGSVSEARLLEQLGEDSNPKALADALNSRERRTAWRGGYFPDESWSVAAARRGPMAAVLQAPRGGAHMVVIEPAADGQFLVRDPIPGVTYQVTPAWIEKFVSGGVFK
jgi:hypothetical protein